MNKTIFSWESQPEGIVDTLAANLVGTALSFKTIYGLDDEEMKRLVEKFTENMRS